ncbi:MAG TPA: hypothetical protein VF528_11935 [Pyrinomonadaceae bacterium]|jgi:hypothetical protein
MIEIGIGVLFAAWFVTLYLLISKLFGPRKQQLAVWRHWTQPTFDAAQMADGKRPQLFLTADALSRHHSQPRGQRHAGQQQQQQQRPDSGQDRRS